MNRVANLEDGSHYIPLSFTGLRGLFSSRLQNQAPGLTS
ncbi:hypothetical protein AC30_5693 [Escherichia coli 3-020-07_S3_C2]|nr:hypothetical protein ECENVIRA101_3632 [Escherichia coli Envira 10/1]EMZ78549.1 hypothetical protein EC2722950_3209 [Escherichia coli 2722950]EYD83744.1 hypothetical protein AB98_3554 [Escherichia coli 1-176-05_S3_C1]KEJ54287.1 hypothetical protein AC30_5693 [Escherichia coli 3-020-07_S3_C2]